MTARIVRLDTVQPEKVSWLWEGRIPLGKLSIIEGDPGVAKSTISLDIIARVTTGRPMPDGSLTDLDGPRDVVIVSVEDGLGDTIRPRLDMAGADCSRVHAIVGIPTDDGYERSVVLPDDWQVIFDVVAEKNAAVVVLDPLMALLGSDTNSYRDQDVRRALNPGVALSEDSGAALLVIRHLNKGASTNAIYRGGGSIGITGAARSVMLVGKDPDDESGERRILAMTKSNLAAQAPALAYHVESPDGHHPRIVWDGVSRHCASDLLLQADEESRSQTDECMDFLKQTLFGNTMEQREIHRLARQHGFSDKVIRRSRERLGVRSERVGGLGSNGRWQWSLPLSTAPKMTQEAPKMPNVPNYENGHDRAGKGRLDGSSNELIVVDAPGDRHDRRYVEEVI